MTSLNLDCLQQVDIPTPAYKPVLCLEGDILLANFSPTPGFNLAFDFLPTCCQLELLEI